MPRLSEEKLIEELLAANDEMNGAFTRYHRLTPLPLLVERNKRIVVFQRVVFQHFDDVIWSFVFTGLEDKCRTVTAQQRR